MRVTGDEQVLKALGQFSGKLSGEVLRRAGQKAATPVIRTAKAFVKPTSKTIAKSIGSKVKVYKRTGKLLVIVGPKATNQSWKIARAIPSSNRVRCSSSGIWGRLIAQVSHIRYLTVPIIRLEFRLWYRLVPTKRMPC